MAVISKTVSAKKYRWRAEYRWRSQRCMISAIYHTAIQLPWAFHTMQKAYTKNQLEQYPHRETLLSPAQYNLPFLLLSILILFNVSSMWRPWTLSQHHRMPWIFFLFPSTIRREPREFILFSPITPLFFSAPPCSLPGMISAEEVHYILEKKINSQRINIFYPLGIYYVEKS